MTNERRLHANRANARQSTGPTSASGKARAAQNARRHGLSLDILADPALGQEVEDLAQRIAHEAGRPDLIDLARRVAKAQVDAQRIRQFRHERMQEGVARLAAGHGCAPTRLLRADELAAALEPLTKTWKAIDRYLRRALSRRKFAMRDFAAAQRQGAGGLKAWAALPARAKRRRPWRSKFPRALGEALRSMDELDQECNAVFGGLGGRKSACRGPPLGCVYSKYKRRKGHEKPALIASNQHPSFRRTELSLQNEIRWRKGSLQTFNLDGDILIG